MLDRSDAQYDRVVAARYQVAGEIRGNRDVQPLLCRPLDYADHWLRTGSGGGDRCVGVGIIRLISQRMVSFFEGRLSCRLICHELDSGPLSARSRHIPPFCFAPTEEPTIALSGPRCTRSIGLCRRYKRKLPPRKLVLRHWSA